MYSAPAIWGVSHLAFSDALFIPNLPIQGESKVHVFR